MVFAGAITVAVAMVAGPIVAIGSVGMRAAATAVSTLTSVELPERLEDAVENQVSLPTVVFAADGSEIGRFRPESLHRPVEWEAIPQSVRVAVVAAEDADFWSHVGVDVRASARALVANARNGEVVQGGSTITQQLVKNLFTTGERTVDRKLEEIKFALEVERRYSKEEILTAYLNSVYFGENAVGIGAAARTYFRKGVRDLSLAEAALLAAVIPAPSTFSPRVDAELAEQRRQLVLDRIAETGDVPAVDVEAARVAPPVVYPARHSSARYPYFVDYVRRWLLDTAQLPPRTLFEGGLRVETTLVPALQDATRDRVRAHLPHPHNPEAAVVVVEPSTGAVRALVGGRSFEDSAVNLALGARGGGTGRQPGSAFKPFVLATAFEAGRSPKDRVAAPLTYTPSGTDAVVHNYTQRGYAPMTLARATERSINTTYVALTDELGPARVAAVARRAGLSVPEDPGASIGIGAYEVSPLAMAAAYGMFASDGRRVHPSPVTQVTRADGALLDIEVPVGPGEPVVSASTARLVTATLQGVIERGTGRAADIGRPAAGKTGTTDDYTNAWFVGYTPHLVASVWVGFEEGAIPMRGINGVSRVTGGSLPAMIWRDVMSAAHRDHPLASFAPAPDRPPSTATTTRQPTTRRRRPTTTTAGPTTAAPTTAAPATTASPTTTSAAPTTTTPPPATTTTAPPQTTTTTERTEPTTTTSTTAPPRSTTSTSTTTPPDAPPPTAPESLSGDE